MDPQKLSQLDPKLRDAYERVMGTAIPQPLAKSDLTKAPPPPITTSQPQPQSGPEPSQPSSSMPQPAIPTQPAANFIQMNSEASPAPAAIPTISSPNFTTPLPQTQNMVLKKKNGVMKPVLFGIVGLIFIVIYTLFWTKIFNLKLPFLP